MLLTEINLAYYQELMAGMRAAIRERQFAAFRADPRSGMGARRYSGAVTRVPHAVQRASDAPQMRDPGCFVFRKPGSRVCAAALRTAARPRHGCTIRSTPIVAG